MALTFAFLHFSRMNYAWADRLRNLATLMVIAIHVAAPITEDHSRLHETWWWVGNFWNSLTRPGVPLFVMLSGYLLLGKDYPTGSFLSKRFSRVIVPALAWMLAYSLYGYLAKKQPADFKTLIINILEGPVHYHLWFIYLIVGLYLTYPILRPWVRTARDADYFYLLVLCAIASYGYKIFHVFFQIELGIYWDFFANNLGYFVIGFYLGKKDLGTAQPSTNEPLDPWRFSEKYLLRLAVAFIVVGTAATMFGAYWSKSSLDARTHLYFYDYLTPNVGLAAVGWFLLARHWFGKKALLPIESALSEASFGIYLAHVFVLDWFSQNGIWHSAVHPFRSIPVLTGVIAIMSFLVVSFIRILPGGKRIT